VAPSPRLSAFRERQPAAEFHQLLARVRSKGWRGRRRSSSRIARCLRRPVRPRSEAQRSFNVIASTSSPFTFTQVTATAKYVGRKVAIYLDDAAPSAAIAKRISIKRALCSTPRLYAVDSARSGPSRTSMATARSGVVLSPAINKLSGQLQQHGQHHPRILLRPGPAAEPGELQRRRSFLQPGAGSANPTCTVPLDLARQYLGPTFIHEFQHMISFNQHVLVRGGDAEATWLNEGLSHFAEELGARKLPDAPGDPAGTRFSQFAVATSPTRTTTCSIPSSIFLIEPLGSLGRLPERGANWLFVRWLIDHFDTDPLGANLTRQLLSTSATGNANVQAVTGQTFATLVTQWQMANYLDDLSGFQDATGRLKYSKLELPEHLCQPSQQDGFRFPLAFPPCARHGGAGYDRTGTLRGGSVGTC